LIALRLFHHKEEVVQHLQESNMTDQKLDVFDFGRQLVSTNDLDPVYVLLWNAQLPMPLLKRWLLSYWCFYHCGTASWIANVIYPGSGDVAFWERMHTAAASKEYPRSSERRHFRGETARKSVTWLQERGVEQLFAPFMEGKQLTVAQVMQQVKTWYGFGDWISFKVADMLERLDICEVIFTNTDAFLFDSPKEGAQLVYDLAEDKNMNGAKTVQEWAMTKVLIALFNYEAPPRYERLINGQEVETILCKFKSYYNGHYHLGEDIAACRRGLMRFARTDLAQKLYAAGREGKLW